VHRSPAPTRARRRARAAGARAAAVQLDRIEQRHGHVLEGLLLGLTGLLLAVLPAAFEGHRLGDLLSVKGRPVRRVIAVECQPSDDSWVELCTAAGVVLVGPATFKTLFVRD
jgi:hypothetical protein